MKTRITQMLAAMVLGIAFSACAVDETAQSGQKIPLSKKECAANAEACRKFKEKCPLADQKMMKKGCCMTKAKSHCARCSTPVLVVYEMDDFFVMPDAPGPAEHHESKAAEGKHEDTKHDDHAKKPMKRVVKPVMKVNKDGKAEPVGYLVFFVEEDVAPAQAAPTKK